MGLDILRDLLTLIYLFAIQATSKLHTSVKTAGTEGNRVGGGGEALEIEKGKQGIIRVPYRGRAACQPPSQGHLEYETLCHITGTVPHQETAYSSVRGYWRREVIPRRGIPPPYQGMPQNHPLQK